jgi:TolB-like protein
MSFFEELKRRNVFRVAIGNINAPDWVMQVFMLALAIGFPLAVFFAWAFEMTPEGVKREADVDRSQSITHKTARKMNRNIIIALLLVVVFLLVDKFWLQDAEKRHQSEQASTSPAAAEPVDNAPTTAREKPEKSVAVLPFVNMSDDKQNEYFSDGISEELLNVLVRVKGLRVPSRTSSFTFKGSDKNLSEIGAELQVDHILEGSVRKANDRIRVTAQLIEVNTDTHLWSETYTRELDDIFAVQDEIAQAIVSALKVTLTGADQAPVTTQTTDNVDAYNNYLLGRHLWNQRSPDSLLASTKPLREAVQADPDYAKAWAALADAYVLIPEYGSGTMAEYIPMAHAAIEKALAINPQSSPALTTSAYIKFMYDYDLKGAHEDFDKAISIDPGYATAHQWLGELLAAEGQLDAALDQLALARRADPLAPIIPHDIACPNFQAAISNLMTLNQITGRYDEARARAHEYARVIGEDISADLAVIDALENPALKPRALELISQATDLPDGTMGKAFYFMILGEHELALDYLETGFAGGDSYAIHMKRMDVYDPVRDHPRFQALLEKMNLWP